MAWHLWTTNKLVTDSVNKKELWKAVAQPEFYQEEGSKAIIIILTSTI